VEILPRTCSFLPKLAILGLSNRCFVGHGAKRRLASCLILLT